MMRCVVLDAEALVALGGPGGRRNAEVRAALRAAARLRREVVVPSVILAELYRGSRHNALVDACLSRETGIRLRDTDHSFARIVGGVLAAAQVGSEHLADAHVIAAAVESGGGIALTRISHRFLRCGRLEGFLGRCQQSVSAKSSMAVVVGPKSVLSSSR